MRSFLQRTAGATFTCGASLTLAFRKDYVEYIFKLQRGYAVINLIPGTDEQLLLADWGHLLPAHHQPSGSAEADGHVGKALPQGGGSDDCRVRLFLDPDNPRQLLGRQSFGPIETLLHGQPGG